MQEAKLGITLPTSSQSEPTQGLKIERQKKLYQLQQKDPYVKVAEGMETQFAQELISQMRKSIPRERDLSAAESYYQSLLDQEYAKKMAASDTGLGIKKVVLEQILPQHLKESPALAKSAYEKMQHQKTHAITARDEVKGVDP
jgi:Rod binding domain-containing protein